MSVPVPSGAKARSEQELAQIATSPTWTRQPNGWADRSIADDDSQHSGVDFGSPQEPKFVHSAFVVDNDGTERIHVHTSSFMSTVHPHSHSIPCNLATLRPVTPVYPTYGSV